jgi:2-keto-4-pentenoate hydratase
MLEQLARRREVLAAGARHVGWKLGVGERERIGGSIAVGYLTTATLLESGGTYRDDRHGDDLRMDVEIAVELADDVDPHGGVAAARNAIGGYGAALEIVDLAPVLGNAEAIVATNVFHRGVAFAPGRPALPKPVRATARVNGTDRGVADAALPLVDHLATAAQILNAVGERLARGDRIITGSLVQVAVASGDDVVADLGALGAVRLTIAN